MYFLFRYERRILVGALRLEVNVSRNWGDYTMFAITRK